MSGKTLAQIVREKPYPDFAAWWPMGERFLDFMARAIVGQWSQLYGNSGDLTAVRATFVEYMDLVYSRAARIRVVDDFAAGKHLASIRSGEFDALSYAFHRTAFELIQAAIDQYDVSLTRARRLFTEQVGRRFFRQLHRWLGLELPPRLDTAADFARLQANIGDVGAFLTAQGYLRDHFAFHFDVGVEHGGRRVRQSADQFLARLHADGVAYALYEMGYPVILPSAVYLFQTVGEAQHHSSRTIEELFALIGCGARETDDFDPTGFPPGRVVELWEIRRDG
jgi:hypothetical protein